MNQFNIYLSGGMEKFGRERFEEGNEWRVDLTIKFQNSYCNYKVHCINPNDYDSFLYKDYDSQLEVMKFDLNKVRKSDLVIVNFNDPDSLGTMAELAVAYDRDIPILGLCENKETLHPWSREMCNKIFTDMEKLFCYVINYYLD